MSEEKHEWQLKNNPKLDRYFSTAIDKGSHTQDSEPGPQQPQASNSSTGTVYTDMNQNVTSKLKKRDFEVIIVVNIQVKVFWDALKITSQVSCKFKGFFNFQKYHSC